jgi:hypothetical protein
MAIRSLTYLVRYRSVGLGRQLFSREKGWTYLKSILDRFTMTGSTCQLALLQWLKSRYPSSVTGMLNELCSEYR